MKLRFQIPEPSSLGLVAHWKLWAGFTSSGKVFDYSLNGNTGTVSGAIPFYPGFLFDGTNDNITVSADPSIDINNKTALTVIAWINPASDGEGDLGRIVHKTDGYDFLITGDATGKVGLRAITRHITSDSNFISNLSVIKNVWSHTAFVFNEVGSFDGKLYLNGTELLLNTDTDGVGDLSNDSTAVFVIGNTIATDGTFDGKIDDVMIYNRALSAAEISDIFQLQRHRYQV